MKLSLTLLSLALWGASLVQPPRAHASTVAVGNCRPSLSSYHTISEAVAAVPPGSTVLVCRGTYPEQITITKSLTLRGVFPINVSGAVITVPSGGSGAQILVQNAALFTPLTVNLSNLTVDGSGSSALSAGISYISASGQLSGLEVLNQNSGIILSGDPFLVNIVNIQDSNIHDFTGSGVSASSDGATGFFVNIARSLIKSGTTSGAGLEYFFTDGIVDRNVILVQGGNGLLLENFFDGMTVQRNTIEGANVGILSGTNLHATGTMIKKNILFNNGTGISLSPFGGAVITSNAIAQSSVEAINVNCSASTSVENNLIFGTPLGIANILPSDTITSNKFLSVGTQTTECQQ